MPTLNLGILAHVDAGKTSLTERLLFDTGVIPRLGSVDAGDTQTDTSEIERRRGITIRTAVASFTAGDRQVNLIDTPGHPDFIAEVERALAILDGAILVLSAVEGVQAQTRILMRVLRGLGVPTIIFANKVDRTGARTGGLLAEIRRRLGVRAVPWNSVLEPGTPQVTTRPYATDDPDDRIRVAEELAEDDDALLAALVDGAVPSAHRLRRAIADRTALGRLYPVVFGSALLGMGIPELLDGLSLLPAAGDGDGDGTLDGLVFAIAHDRTGGRLAYVRLRAGELRPRQRIWLHRPEPDGGVRHSRARVTAVDEVGSRSGTLTAGNIARVGGLSGVRVGDRIGPAPSAVGDTVPHPPRPTSPRFPRPTLETLVVPRDRSRTTDLRAALTTLADRDPLIRTRPLDGGRTSVLLYGEVQQEVVAATLRDEFGIEASFAGSRIVHLERPVGSGEAVEEMSRAGFPATVGLRVEPAPAGSGVSFQVAIEPGVLKVAFHRAIEDTVRRGLDQGLAGWPVTDCAVTLIRGGYAAPVTTARHFRHLTPLVLFAALAAAGTRVFEPCHSFELEMPATAAGTVLSRLAGFEADLRGSRQDGASWLVEGDIPARCVPAFQQLLPRLTGGEGSWSSRPAGDRPVRGRVPVRERTDGNPLDRPAYLHHIRQTGLR